MSIHERVDAAGFDVEPAATITTYVEALALIERLHRLLLDVIKDEFERLGRLDINSVQALLLYNIGDNEVTAGELKSRGYYQGSNVSYNLKKLVEGGYMHHQRCEIDRRAVRIKLTDEGRKVREIVGALFEKHSELLGRRKDFGGGALKEMILNLRGMERFWSEQIRYIY
ncbi:MAG: winged helix DNA-binding protein [Pikeienuella sp.]|uniref:winged helix DNA-binding protein n=1 Tax=Pikeienuella sp. TaxID=2831957 RepID=UPI00391C8E86